MPTIQATTVLIDTKPTTNGHATATVQTAKSKRTVDASQRRAEIVIAALFLLTAATSIFGAFALEPGLYAADYLSKIFPKQGNSRVERPAVVVHQHREPSLSRCSRSPCSGSSMKPWRPGTWLPGSSRAPS